MTTPPHVLAARIRAALVTIVASYDAVLVPVTRATGSHATNPTIAPLLVSAHILDVRATCHERLGHWSRVVMRGQKLHREGAAGIPAMCAFLTIHAQWLAASPSGTNALDELEHSAGKLAEIAADSVPRRQVVGPCTGTTNGQPCPGTITATIRRDEDLLPSELRCDATPCHAFPAGEWKTMERRLHAQASVARRLTAQRGTDVMPAALRRLVDAIHCDAAHTDQGSHGT